MEILLSMIKEEWRIHSSMFGHFLFAFFPVLVASFAFAGCLSLPFVAEFVPAFYLSLSSQYFFLLFGLSVGAFGLLGREFMNRRFGHASLIAYSSRTLPVSERTIFANFIVKDIIYYFILWIIPFWLGFTLALPVISLPLAYSPMFLLASTLSFLIGLSASFSLSVVYVNSRKILAASFFLIAAAIYAGYAYLGIGIGSLPSFLLFQNPSLELLMICISAAVVPSLISLFFIKIDFPESKKNFENLLNPLSSFFRPSGYAELVAKDIIDLQRSEGGMGKIIFSFVFPLAIVWLMLSVFTRFIPIANFIILFAVFLGVISSSIYNWLTEFDLFNSYSFLPMKVSEIIKSKIVGYAIINSVSVLILIAASVIAGQTEYLAVSLISMISVSAYCLSTIIYLSGLFPNLMLYNAKVFMKYIGMNSPVLMASIFLSAVNPAFIALSILLLPVAYMLILKSLKKWDSQEQPSF